MDDYIPVEPATGRPAFFRSDRKQLFWAILIEKAWAKVYGSYYKISKGL